MTTEAETETSAEGSAEGQAADTQGASTATASLVGPDGKFTDGWKNALPEDLRGEKTLDTFTDLTGAMKMLVGSVKKIGMKGVIVPGEKATPEEKDAFFKALGRPDAPADYKIEVPKGLEDYYDKDYMEGVRKGFHKIGLTQAQAGGILAMYDRMVKEGMAREAAEEEVAHAKAEKVAREKWGADYDLRLHLANRMIAENVDEKIRPELLKEIGNSIPIADFLASIAEKFMVDGAMPTDADQAAAGGVQDAIQKLRSTQGYADGKLQRTNPSEYQRITEQLDALYRRAYPDGGSR